jgi:putative membrane protein
MLWALGEGHSIGRSGMAKITWTALMALPLLAIAAENSPDEAFYKDAAEGGLAEIQLSEVAQDNCQSSAVKNYAAMMIKDHSAANDKLRAIAVAKRIALPTTPKPERVATRTSLSAQSGDACDKAYIKAMLQDHQDTVEVFQKEDQTGQDAEAKAFAKATLPTLQQHLKSIQAIARTAGLVTD